MACNRVNTRYTDHSRIERAWASNCDHCFTNLQKDKKELLNLITNSQYIHKTSSILELMYNALLVYFSKDELQTMYIDKLWAESHKNYLSIDGAMFAIKYSQKYLEKIIVKDILFNHIVYRDEFTELSPYEVFKMWRDHRTNLDKETIKKIASKIKYSDKTEYWDDGDNDSIISYFKWYNKNIGHLTGYYVTSFEYFEDFEDNRYDFKFNKINLDIKEDSILKFTSDNIQTKQLIPGFIGGIASFVDGSFKLKINDKFYDS